MAEIKRWITVNGRRVPIFEGELKEEAVNKFIKSSKSLTPENDDDKYFARRREMRKAEQEAESVKNKARIKREYDRIAKEEKTNSTQQKRSR